MAGKKLLRSTLGLAILAVLLLSSVPFALADGMAYRSQKVYVPENDLTKDEWGLLTEKGQTALIDYNYGKEYLSIAINVEPGDAEKMVWIFPVPAKADETNINLNIEIPQFFGDEVYNKAGEKVSGFAHGMRNTLGLPLIAEAFSTVFSMTASLSSNVAAGYDAYKYQLGENVTVHQQRELFGIEAQVITATSGNAIRDYLWEKGFALPGDAAGILDSYIGQDYSFVVGWVSDYRQLVSQQGSLKERLMTISVIFPTDELYFPLKPTSVYGGITIPVNLYVSGYVSPHFPGKTAEAKYNDVRFYLNEKAENELQKKFTKISIEAPSMYFEDDLWIDNSAPLGVSIADSIFRNEYVWFILFLLGFSCLASLIVGNIVFFGKGVKQWALLLIGAANVLTIVPFILTALFWDFDKNRFSGKWEKENPKKKEVTRRDRAVFIFAFIALFIILTYTIEAAWGAGPRGHWETVYPEYQARMICQNAQCESDINCQDIAGCSQFNEVSCIGAQKIGGQTIRGYCQAVGDFSDIPRV